MTPEEQQVHDETERVTRLIRSWVEDIIRSGYSPVVLCRALAVTIGFIIGNRITDVEEQKQAARGLVHLIADVARREIPERTLN